MWRNTKLSELPGDNLRLNFKAYTANLRAAQLQADTLIPSKIGVKKGKIIS